MKLLGDALGVLVPIAIKGKRSSSVRSRGGQRCEGLKATLTTVGMYSGAMVRNNVSQKLLSWCARIGGCGWRTVHARVVSWMVRGRKCVLVLVSAVGCLDQAAMLPCMVRQVPWVVSLCLVVAVAVQP